LRTLGVGFIEQLLPFGAAGAWQPYRSLVPSGEVPCLADGSRLVWDSLSIAEYVHGATGGVWPAVWSITSLPSFALLTGLLVFCLSCL
jgi:glutathione S-transferase